MSRRLPYALVLALLLPATGYARYHRAAARKPASSGGPASPCVRYGGRALHAPPDLFSRHGLLKAQLSYRTGLAPDGTVSSCYMTPDGQQNPTLHLFPGDRLVLTLTNDSPAPAAAMDMKLDSKDSDDGHPRPHAMKMPTDDSSCGAKEMNAASTNLHYHGTNLPAVCHQDEVLRTLVNAGESFTYDMVIPLNEPPGLYWYHPHVHGMSEAAVQAGASGALVVRGIEELMADASRLPERVLVIRDQVIPNGPKPGGAVPSWNLSLNSTPVLYPDYKPVIVPVRPGERQLWRVVNASADAYLDLQLKYDGAVQSLRVVAYDGVPVGSQDGHQLGRALDQKHVFLSPAARAEFVVTAPAAEVKSAVLSTLSVDTGPDGDSDPERPLAALVPTPGAPLLPSRLPPSPRRVRRPRFAGLEQTTPAASRRVYFSEILSDPNNPESPTTFT